MHHKTPSFLPTVPLHLNHLFAPLPYSLLHPLIGVAAPIAPSPAVPKKEDRNPHDGDLSHPSINPALHPHICWTMSLLHGNPPFYHRSNPGHAPRAPWPWGTRMTAWTARTLTTVTSPWSRLNLVAEEVEAVVVTEAMMDSTATTVDMVVMEVVKVATIEMVGDGEWRSF